MNVLTLGEISNICAKVLERTDRAITEDMSLTADVGLDSLQIMDFFSIIEKQCPEVEFDEWFLGMTSEGCDTIRSLLELCNAQHRLAA